MCWLGIIFNLLLSYLSVGQDNPNVIRSQESLQFGVHSSVGLANFSLHSTSPNKIPVFAPSAGVYARWFLNGRWAVQPEINYLSLGANYKPDFGMYTLRLRNLQVHMTALYGLRSTPTGPTVALKGGLFLGYLLEPILYYHDYSSDVRGQSRPVATFKQWNAGVVIGVEVSNLIPTLKGLTFSLQNEVGLLDIYTNTTVEGSRCFTRAYHLLLAYPFVNSKKRKQD